MCFRDIFFPLAKNMRGIFNIIEQQNRSNKNRSPRGILYHNGKGLTYLSVVYRCVNYIYFISYRIDI